MSAWGGEVKTKKRPDKSQPIFLQDLLSVCTCVLMIADSYYTVAVRPFSYLFSLGFFAVDICKHHLQPDFLIHHLLSASIIGLHHIVPYTDETLAMICRTEWSTLLLTAVPYVPAQYHIPLQLSFAATFFRFRIYAFFHFFQMQCLAPVQAAPILGLYVLNLYWFVLICKKAAKPLKHYNLNRLNHHICSYTMIAVSGLLFYQFYPFLPFIRMMSCFLALSSYLYHQEIALQFDGLPSAASRWIYYDVSVFHFYQAGYVYLTGTQYGKVAWLSHLLNVLYIWVKRPDDISTAALPSFGVDVAYLLIDTQSIELLTVSLLIFFIHFINPFYDLSFVSTHMLLCWYILSRATHLMELQ